MFLKIWKDIKRGKLSTLYLLYGNESFLINETQNLITSSVLSEETKEFNLSRYDMEETPIEFAIEDCQTIPFFGDKKVVIIENPYFLTGEKGKEKVEHNAKVFEEYLINPVPSTILIVNAPYEKLDERRKIVKQLMKNAVVLNAKFTEKETKDWIQEQVEERGYEISRNAIELLYQFIGQNLLLLNNEIEKLVLYSEKQEIDEMTVHLLASKSLESNIFVLVDQVVHQRLNETLTIYHDLLKQNEEPIKILAVIAGQFRFIAQVKSLVSKGYGEQKIANILKAHPYRVKLAVTQGKVFDEKKLLQMIDALAELDYQMKTGFGNKEKMLELFFFRYLT